jgi:hypothetical protein
MGLATGSHVSRQQRQLPTTLTDEKSVRTEHDAHDAIVVTPDIHSMVGVRSDILSMGPALNRKRTASDMEGRPAKRIRIRHHEIRYRQAGAEEAALGAKDDVFFQGQLLRAISLELSAVGFTGATPEALEAFRADVEECEEDHCELFGNPS